SSTIAFTETGAGLQALQSRETQRGYSVVAHLRIRNESVIALNRWCFSTDLVDYSGKGKPVIPTISNAHSATNPLCSERLVTSGSVATFDLSLPIAEQSLPWSGVLI